MKLCLRCCHLGDVQVDARAHGGADGEALHVRTFDSGRTSLQDVVINHTQVFFQFVVVKGNFADYDLNVACFVGTVLNLAGFDFIDGFGDVRG